MHIVLTGSITDRGLVRAKTGVLSGPGKSHTGTMGGFYQNQFDEEQLCVNDNQTLSISSFEFKGGSCSGLSRNLS